MGMFDNDELYGGERLDETFSFGDTFILWDAEVLTKEVPTEVGNARKSILTVSREESPDDKFKVGTLASAIADKVADAEASDFPSVVKYHQVHSSKWGTDAAVISLVERYNAEAPTPLD